MLLTLVASTDVILIIILIVEKCIPKFLWQKSGVANRYTVVADKVAEVAKRKLLMPTPTRWNSCYVVQITENSTTELNELCAEMGF